MAGDELLSRIRSWLAPPDPWKNYHIGHELRHSETGAWFVNSSTFSEWKAFGPSSLLWITRETLVYRPLIALSQKLIGYSFHSWRWKECTLVR